MTNYQQESSYLHFLYHHYECMTSTTLPTPPPQHSSASQSESFPKSAAKGIHLFLQRLQQSPSFRLYTALPGTDLLSH